MGGACDLIFELQAFLHVSFVGLDAGLSKVEARIMNPHFSHALKALRYSRGNRSTNHPKFVFQVSEVDDEDIGPKP